MSGTCWGQGTCWVLLFAPSKPFDLSLHKPFAASLSAPSAPFPAFGICAYPALNLQVLPVSFIWILLSPLPCSPPGYNLSQCSPLSLLRILPLHLVAKVHIELFVTDALYVLIWKTLWHGLWIGGKTPRDDLSKNRVLLLSHLWGCSSWVGCMSSESKGNWLG